MAIWFTYPNQIAIFCDRGEPGGRCPTGKQANRSQRSRHDAAWHNNHRGLIPTSLSALQPSCATGSNTTGNPAHRRKGTTLPVQRERASGNRGGQPSPARSAEWCKDRFPILSSEPSTLFRPVVALPAERVLNVFLSAHCASPVRQSVTNLAIATTRAGDRVDSSEVLPMRPGLGDYYHDLQDRVNATSALTSRPPPASPARRELMCASTCPHPCLPNCAILTCSNCAHTTSTARSYGKSPAKSPLRNRRSARRRLARFGVLVTHSEPQRRDAGPHGCLSSLRNGAKAATDARRSAR